MDFWLNATIAFLTCTTIGLMLWVFRPSPRRLTRESEFRRERVRLSRRRTWLLVLMAALVSGVVYVEAARFVMPNAFRALYVVAQLVMVGKGVQFAIDRRRREIARPTPRA
jgi:undecaprenyl pyrophosphate phosphatase UppP